MNKRWFCLVLVALLICSLAAAGPRSVMALTLSSKGSKEVRGERVVFPEELRGRRDVGRRIQQLGFSPGEVETKLNELTQEEISFLAKNLSLIQQGGADEDPMSSVGVVLMVVLVVVLIAFSSISV